MPFVCRLPHQLISFRCFLCLLLWKNDLSFNIPVSYSFLSWLASLFIPHSLSFLQFCSTSLYLFGKLPCPRLHSLQFLPKMGSNKNENKMPMLTLPKYCQISLVILLFTHILVFIKFYCKKWSHLKMFTFIFKVYFIKPFHHQIIWCLDWTL